MRRAHFITLSAEPPARLGTRKLTDLPMIEKQVSHADAAHVASARRTKNLIRWQKQVTLQSRSSLLAKARRTTP
jgi:hypothetical protein